jgi:hypothetical protein
VAEPLNASVVRDRNPDLDRLAMVVSGPDGSSTRWADDEPEVENIPTDLTLSGSIPGGDADLSCGLLRDLTYRAADLRNRNAVLVHGPGAEPTWRGYLAKTPATKTTVSPAAVGEVNRLKGDPTLRMIPVDRDLSHWGPAGITRKINNNIGNSPTSDASVISTADGQALHLEVSGAWINPLTPRVEAWYDAGPGMQIERVSGGLLSTEATQWHFGLYGADTAAGDGVTTESGDLWAGATTAFSFFPSPAKRLMIALWIYTATPAGADGDTFAIDFMYVCVGGTDVPRQEMNDGQNGFGVYGQDVLDAILTKAGNGITFDRVNSAVDRFIIPHLVWLEPVTAEQAILDTNRFFRNLWGVYDGKLKWAPAESFGQRWHVRRDEGADPQAAGDDIEREINGVVVKYQDSFTGEAAIVGPPVTGLVGPGGMSTAGLAITDPYLPVNEWNQRAIAEVQAGLTSEAGAIRIGEMFREGIEAATGSGSIEIGNWQVYDDTGARYPAWAPREGDRLVEDDVPGRPERLIVQRNYKRASRTSTLTLDAPPDALQALQERLQVVLVGVTG